MAKILSLDEMLAEYEPERQAALARDLAIHDSPEVVARREARRAAEFEAGIRLGFHDADGNPIDQPEDDDEEEDDEGADQ